MKPVKAASGRLAGLKLIRVRQTNKTPRGESVQAGACAAPSLYSSFGFDE